MVVFDGLFVLFEFFIKYLLLLPECLSYLLIILKKNLIRVLNFYHFVLQLILFNFEAFHFLFVILDLYHSGVHF